MNSRHFNLNGLLALIIIFILFTGCNKEKLVGEYYLTDEMKQTVPFNGSETIYFIDDEDTVIFSSGKRIRSTRTTYITFTKYTIGENDATKFVSLNQNYYMYYRLMRNHYHNNPGIMKVGWIEDNDNTTINEGIVVFNIPLSETSLRPGQWVIDELTIQGVKYNSIYCDSTSVHVGDSGPNDPKTFYYTEDAGIIKIDFTQGNSWELLKIDWD